MKTKNWVLLYIGSLIFILTAPIEKGNGATLLGIILAGYIIYFRPKGKQMVENPNLTDGPHHCEGCNKPYTFCTCWEEEQADWWHKQPVIDQQATLPYERDAA